MRTNMKYWPAKRLLCLALCILVLVSFAMPSINTFTMDGREPLLGRLFGVTEAKADDPFTVTYYSGDGTFSNGSTVNEVGYMISAQTPVTKYSHTPNVADDGSQNGNYDNKLALNDVVTIPGAESLIVTITYGGESARYDWACMWEGNHPNYTAANNYSSSLTGQLGGGSHTAQSNTKTYTISGDTVTFAFRSDYSGCGDGYGYYATVYWDGASRTITSGSYDIPTSNDPEYRFKEWNTAADGSGTVVSISDVTSTITLYAIYEEDILAKGDWWKIKGDGTLIIGDGTNITIPVNSISASIWPWDSYRSQITSARFSGVVHAGNSASYMFYNCSSLTSLDVSGFDTSNVTNMCSMFSNCSNLISLDLSNFDTSKVTDMSYMFDNCGALTSLDVSGWDTSNVTDMANMFNKCSLLTSLDASGFDTSNVTRMYGMFNKCSSLTSLDLSEWDTSNVTNMSYMFYGCSSFTSLDVSNFDTSNVTEMAYTFSGCCSLTSLDLNNFNTRNVTNMVQMLYGCSQITSLDLSHFDTSKVTNMMAMFMSCRKLANLDISSFDTSNVTNAMQMFDDCPELSEIKLGEDFAFNGKNILTISSKAILPTPPSSTTTGKWVLEDDELGTSAMTPEQMRDAGSVSAGTWVWQEKQTQFTVIYDYNDGTGNADAKKYTADEDATLLSTYPYRFNKVVSEWNTSDDGTGTSYELGALLPANTYTAGTSVTLFAIWEDVQNVEKISDGVYQVQVPGNAQIKLDGIPAGTFYRVSEMLPNGWILVNQSNSSGSIGPLTNSVSTFINKYMPESASAAIYATKTMDGAPATEDMAFEFTLKEGDNVIQTVTAANGAVLFDPIIYTSAGTHVYTIVENWETYSGPLDASGVTFDTHVETVTVEVSDNGGGKLSAEVTYDADGPAFANRTNPGDLIITKNVVGQTAANADDTFTFTIRIKSPTGGDINSASIEIGKLPTAEQSPEPTP